MPESMISAQGDNCPGQAHYRQGVRLRLQGIRRRAIAMRQSPYGDDSYQFHFQEEIQTEPSINVVR